MDFHYYNHEPAGVRKMKIIAEVLASECKRAGKTTLNILDVGCGNGHLSAFMASLGHKVVGVDTSQAAILAAKENYKTEGVDFMVGEARGVSGVFDVVTAFEVFEHVPGEQEFIKEVGQRLAPCGLLLVSVPNGWSLEELVRRFIQNTPLGRNLKSTARASGALPKSNAQSAADSPHVRWRGYYAWTGFFSGACYCLEGAWNVSLFFKQLYYLGFRRFIKPSSIIFKVWDWLDGIIAEPLSPWLADGWVMSWRKK